MENNNLFNRQNITSYSMKKKAFIFLTLILAIFLISNVSAFETWKIKYIQLNNSKVNTNYGLISYTSDVTGNPQLSLIGVGTLFPLLNLGSSQFTDYLDGATPLEVKIKYNSYVDFWNKANPQYLVDYCDLQITYQPYYSILYNVTQTPSVVLFYKNFTTTIDNGQYFVRLKKGDTAYVRFNCYFINDALLEAPANFVFITPTENCQECQYYEWNKIERTLTKVGEISSFKTKILGYIVRFLDYNYEVILIFYYIFLIIALTLFGGLIIYAMIYLYTFAKKWTK